MWRQVPADLAHSWSLTRTDGVTVRIAPEDDRKIMGTKGSSNLVDFGIPLRLLPPPLFRLVVSFTVVVAGARGIRVDFPRCDVVLINTLPVITLLYTTCGSSDRLDAILSRFPSSGSQESIPKCLASSRKQNQPDLQLLALPLAFR